MSDRRCEQARICVNIGKNFNRGELVICLGCGLVEGMKRGGSVLVSVNMKLHANPCLWLVWRWISRVMQNSDVFRRGRCSYHRCVSKSSQPFDCAKKTESCISGSYIARDRLNKR